MPVTLRYYYYILWINWVVVLPPYCINWGHLCSFIQLIPGLGWAGTSKTVASHVWVLLTVSWGASLVILALRWSLSPCGAPHWFPMAAVIN